MIHPHHDRINDFVTSSQIGTGIAAFAIAGHISQFPGGL
jgi:hypothetical protein